MNKFVVGKVSDFKEGTKKRVMAGDRVLMLVMTGGRFYAIDDVCSHAKSSLTAGKLDGFEIECPFHGAKFDVRTGAVVALPAAVPVRTYQVEAEGENIVVSG